MSEGLDLVAALEAVLFAAPEPLPERELARVLGVEPPLVAAALRRLAERYDAGGHGIQLHRTAGGYRLCTRPELAAVVARLQRPRRVTLSPAALETLAIVAYRQPVTRAEIEALRGVGSESPLATLVEHGLVEEVGRREAPGRPILYGTTRRFLEYLGIDDLSQLPPLPDGPAAGVAGEVVPDGRGRGAGVGGGPRAAGGAGEGRLDGGADRA